MNIVQLHERARFWVDVVSSTRFESEDIDNALNAAIDNRVTEAYDKHYPLSKSDTFQRTQRVRDELHKLVIYYPYDHALSFVLQLLDEWAGYYLFIPESVGYRHLLSLKIKMVSGAVLTAYPMTQDRINTNPKNPFRRVRMTHNPKVYYQEAVVDETFPAGHYWKLIFDESTGLTEGFYPVTPDGAELYWLRNPAIVNYGIEYDLNKSFSEDDVIYAVQETVYDGTTYKIGDKIIVTAGQLTITSGLVVFDYVETDMHTSTHEEISRRAAINCLLTASETAKANELRKEIMAS